MSAFKYDKLRNSRILIVGGDSSVGFATAEACIEAGATVIISSSSTERLYTALSKLNMAYFEAAASDKIHGYTCDVTQAIILERNLKALLKSATEDYTKKIDHICFTEADTPEYESVADFRPSEYKSDSIIVRYDAPILLSKLAPPYLNPGPRSSITFTGSSTASKPTPGRGLLTAIGASTEGIAKGLAVDLVPIRVNVVSPGTLATDLKDQAGIKEMLEKVTLLEKVGEPEEVAEAYVYLMKDSNITGAVIHTDAGRLLK